MTKKEISPNCNKCGRRLKMYVDNEDTGTYGYFCEYCDIIKKTRQEAMKEVEKIIDEGYLGGSSICGLRKITHSEWVLLRAFYKVFIKELKEKLKEKT